MKYTHRFAVGLGIVVVLAVAFALRMAGEGWSAGRLEAAAAETISASNAEQHPKVGNIPAECRSETQRSIQKMKS